MVSMLARGWLIEALHDARSKRKGLSVGVGAWAALAAHEAEHTTASASAEAHFTPIEETSEVDKQSDQPPNEEAFG